jgi:hypothetical protein
LLGGKTAAREPREKQQGERGRKRGILLELPPVEEG